VLALGIDTSTPTVSVALVDGDRLLGRRDELVHNGHGEVLAGLIDDVCRRADASMHELAAVGVGLGPGPFTGLRVGVVTAAAMADALHLPAYGVCSLDVIDGLSAHEAPYAVVTDARRRQVYWAVYNASGERIDGPEISTATDLADHLRGRVGDIRGPAAESYAEAFEGFRICATTWPDAGRIARHASRQLGDDQPSEALTPLYLRRPDAREPGPPKRVTPA
jgi:tRNA threonylcarbamoyladenosine biosynthesis protein TsaB